MAKIPANIKKSVDQLIQRLNTNKIQIREAYIFGSFAKNQQSKWSDIDLALVSEQFEGNFYYDRCKVNPFVIKIDTRIEAHPFHPQDFTEANPFVKEIIRSGIRII